MAMTETAGDRLSETISRLRIQTVRARVNERTLLYVGGGLAGLGLVAVLLGYWGAAHTIVVQEQTPYLISGGLLGLGLVFLGGFCYFAYWVTRLVQEQRRQTDTLLDALNRLASSPNGSVRISPSRGRSDADRTNEEGLVATAKGTMAHQPDCSVVAGKRGLRKVKPNENLELCKLCN
jgi:hypothetical protein